MHAFNPTNWEAEAGGSPSWSQAGLQTEFQDCRARHNETLFQITNKQINKNMSGFEKMSS